MEIFLDTLKWCYLERRDPLNDTSKRQILIMALPSFLWRDQGHMGMPEACWTSSPRMLGKGLLPTVAEGLRRKQSHKSFIFSVFRPTVSFTNVISFYLLHSVLLILSQTHRVSSVLSILEPNKQKTPQAETQRDYISSSRQQSKEQNQDSKLAFF